MILIASGSNLPTCGVAPQEIVKAGFLAFSAFANLTGTSRLYETPAWPDRRDPKFVNAVAMIETDLAPTKLLAALHAIECAFNRARSNKNAPRTLDLDIIAYNDVVLDLAGGLKLPHPRMAERAFVLAPLAEIAPNWSHPVHKMTASQMLAKIDTSAIRLFS